MLRNWWTSYAGIVKQYLVSVLIVVGALICYRAYHTYQHFEWIHTTNPAGTVYAVPAFRK